MSVRSAALDSRRFWGWLAAITTAGAVLRFWHLGQRSLWFDEGVSVGFARLPWHEMWLAMWEQANMLFYYVGLRGWMFFGDSEFWLRTFSVIPAIVSIVLLALFGRRYYGSAVGIISAAMLSVSVLHVHYSHDVRGYPLLVLLLILSWWFHVRALRSGRGPDFAWWAVCATAAIYTHLFAVLIFAAQAVCIGFAPSQYRRIRWSVLAIASVAALCLPLAVAARSGDGQQISWIPPLSRQTFQLFVYEFSGAQLTPLIVSLAVFLVLLGFFARTLFREGLSEKAWLMSIPIIGTILPVVLVLLTSIFLEPCFLPRYLIVALPFFLLGVALVLTRLPRWIAAPLLVVILAGNILGLRTYFNEPPWNDYRSATSYIAGNAKPGDALVIWGPQSRFAVDYYAAKRPAETPFPTIVYPPSLTVAGLDAHPDVNQINQLSTRFSRVWLLFDFDIPESEYPVYAKFFMRRLELQYRDHSLARFSHVQVLEFSNKTR